MFDPKQFKTSDSNKLKVNLIGGIDSVNKNISFTFNKNWKMMQKNGIVLIGRRNNSPNCFSLKPMRDVWEIAFYEDECPADKLLQLRNDEPLGDAEFFESDPTNKYLYLDLIKFMKDRDIDWE